MEHYVLFKFRPDYPIDTLENLFHQIYPLLKKELPDITDIDFCKNCVVRDTNMDVMLHIQLKNRACLKDYLQHPLHKKFIAMTQEDVIERVTFDCNENSSKEVSFYD